MDFSRRILLPESLNIERFSARKPDEEIVAIGEQSQGLAMPKSSDDTTAEYQALVRHLRKILSQIPPKPTSAEPSDANQSQRNPLPDKHGRTDPA
jgi:hypothetical protein